MLFLHRETLPDVEVRLTPVIIQAIIDAWQQSGLPPQGSFSGREVNSLPLFHFTVLKHRGHKKRPGFPQAKLTATNSSNFY